MIQSRCLRPLTYTSIKISVFSSHWSLSGSVFAYEAQDKLLKVRNVCSCLLFALSYQMLEVNIYGLNEKKSWPLEILPRCKSKSSQRTIVACSTTRHEIRHERRNRCCPYFLELVQNPNIGSGLVNKGVAQTKAQIPWFDVEKQRPKNTSDRVQRGQAARDAAKSGPAPDEQEFRGASRKRLVEESPMQVLICPVPYYQPCAGLWWSQVLGSSNRWHQSSLVMQLGLFPVNDTRRLSYPQYRFLCQPGWPFG